MGGVIELVLLVAGLVGFALHAVSGEGVKTNQVPMSDCVYTSNDFQDDVLLDVDQKSDEKSGRIDINTATVEELRSIPGIGEGHAIRIAQYVETHGPLKTPREIKNVPWIGNETYDNVKDYMEVTNVNEDISSKNEG